MLGYKIHRAYIPCTNILYPISNRGHSIYRMGLIYLPCKGWCINVPYPMTSIMGIYIYYGIVGTFRRVVAFWNRINGIVGGSRNLSVGILCSVFQGIL
jgi:hypothetical protein